LTGFASFAVWHTADDYDKLFEQDFEIRKLTVNNKEFLSKITYPDRIE
jgi:hypothetical protein